MRTDCTAVPSGGGGRGAAAPSGIVSDIAAPRVSFRGFAPREGYISDTIPSGCPRREGLSPKYSALWVHYLGVSCVRPICNNLSRGGCRIFKKLGGGVPT